MGKAWKDERVEDAACMLLKDPELTHTLFDCGKNEPTTHTPITMPSRKNGQGRARIANVATQQPDFHLLWMMIFPDSRRRHRFP